MNILEKEETKGYRIEDGGSDRITWESIYGRLGTRRLGTIFLCISFVA
jgi:hypothetical protein